MECIPISALTAGQKTACICVRASRVWHYRGGLDHGEVKNIRMVLLDAEGQSIYGVVPPGLIAANINILHETGVYKIRLFEVSAQQKVMGIVKNSLAVVFTSLTVVQPVLDPNDDFPEWTYELTSFKDFPAPSSAPKRFLDVIGVIRAVSDIAACTMAGSSAPAYRRQLILDDNSGDQVKVSLWGEAAWRFNGQAIRFLGQEETAVVIFVGMTVQMCEGSRELAGAVACRWYINEDIQEINILRVRAQGSFKPIEQIQLSHRQNTPSHLNGRYPMISLSQLLAHGSVHHQDNMFRCNVSIWRLAAGRPWWVLLCTRCRAFSAHIASSDARLSTYVCSNPECLCADASLEYRLQLIGSDGTGEAEFTLSQRVAEAIIGSSPRQVILNNCPNSVPTTDLSIAATHIMHTPPEIAAVVSSRYTFVVDATETSFDEGWPSFHVHAAEVCYPDEG